MFVITYMMHVSAYECHVYTHHVHVYTRIYMRMHPEVDNEEGSTIRLYKSIPYKMYGIMHNLRNIKTTERILTR